MNIDGSNPVDLWFLLVLGTGMLLLAIPVVPPQAAIFATIGLGLLGVVLYGGGLIIAERLSQAAESIQENAPDDDEAAPVNPITEAREAYVDGELSDEELEAELDDILAEDFEAEMDKITSDEDSEGDSG